MQDWYIENFKTSLKELRRIYISRKVAYIRGLEDNMVKTLIVPRWIFTFNGFFIEIPPVFFLEIYKMTIRKFKAPRIATIIKKKMEDLHFSISKLI